MINATDFLAAIALMLVIEGIVPFLNPSGLRRALDLLARLDDRSLRIGGLVSMLAGVTLLYFARN
jgi:uncharacterized protein YjeT (DUF2065 family)